MPTVTELLVRISGDASSAISALNKVNNAQVEVTSSAEDMEKTLQQLARSTALAGNASAEAAAKYEVENGALKELTESQKLAVVIQARAKDEAVANAAAQAQALKQEEEATKSLARELSAIPTKMKQVGQSLTWGLSLPLAAFVGLSAAAASSFDDAMAKVAGAGGAGVKEIQALRDQVLELSADSGKSPKELADALYFVESMGYRGAKAMEVLNVAAKLSEAGFGEVADIAKTLTFAVNAYGAENLSAAKAADIFAATVREGAMAADSVAGALGRVLPEASRLQIPFGQLGGALASMTRIGLSFDEAVTALRQTLLTVDHPSAQTKKALASVGLTAQDVSRSLKVDLLGTLADLAKRSEKGGETFARIFPNVRAFTGVLSLTGKQANEVAGVMDRVTNSAGAVDAAVKPMANTIGHEFRQSLQEVTRAGIEMGDALAPEFKAISDGVKGAAHWFDSLDQSTKATFGEIATIGIFVGPAILIFGGLAGAIQKVISLGATIQGWAASVSGSMATAGAAATGAAGDFEVLASAEKDAALAGGAAGTAGAGGAAAGIGGLPVIGGLVAYGAATFFGDKAIKDGRKQEAHVNDVEAKILSENEKFLADHWKKSHNVDDLRYAAKVNYVPQKDVDDFVADQFASGQRSNSATAGTTASRRPDPLGNKPNRPLAGTDARGAKKAASELKAYQDSMYEIQKAMDLAGKSSDALALSYDIQHHHLDGLTPAQAKNKLALLEQSEAQDKVRESQKKLEDESKRHAEAMNDEFKAQHALTASTVLDKIAYEEFGKAFGQLTDKRHKDEVSAKAHTEELKRNKEAVDSIKSSIEDLTRDTALMQTTDERERASLEILNKGYATLTAEQKKQIDLYVQKKRVQDDLVAGMAFEKKAEDDNLAAIVAAVEANAELSKADAAAAAQLEQSFSNSKASLAQQIALYGQTGEAAKISYELQTGSLKDLTDAQKDELLGLASQIDGMKEFTETAKQAEEEHQRLADNMQEVYTGAFEGINRGFKGVVEGLVGGWEKMLGKMASDYLTSQLAQISTSFLGHIFGQDFASVLAGGPVGGSNGAAGLVGAVGLVGGSSGGSGSPIPGLDALGFPMHGDGGDVFAGQPSIVGDRYRPEVFVPSSDGHIFPSTSAAKSAAGQAATNGGGGGHTIIHQSINISTPNPGAFRESQHEILAQMGRAAQKAAKRDR